MLKQTFTILLIFILSSKLVAQDAKIELKDNLTRLNNGEDLNVLYRNESSFGFYVHSAGGFGLAYRRGVHVTGKRKRMFEIEASNFKHPKEVKSVSYHENSKGYVYGKLNSIFLIRPGVGYQNILFQKSDKKSVEIRYSYFLGATIAFAKPIYLEISHNYSTTGSLGTITTERYNPDVHKPEDILGKASFFKGIGNTKIYPGAYAKASLSFEYGDRFNSLKAIETGVIADIYPNAIPMMAFNKKQDILFSLYLKFILGKKWF